MNWLVRAYYRWKLKRLAERIIVAGNAICDELEKTLEEEDDE